MLFGGTQQRAMPRHRIEEMKICNISLFRVGNELTTDRVSSATKGLRFTSLYLFVISDLISNLTC